MNNTFANQVFNRVDFDREHESAIREIEHMTEEFNIPDREFDDLVSETIGELFVFSDDPLLANLTKDQVISVYDALRAKYE